MSLFTVGWSNEQDPMSQNRIVLFGIRAMEMPKPTTDLRTDDGSSRTKFVAAHRLPLAARAEDPPKVH